MKKFFEKYKKIINAICVIAIIALIIALSLASKSSKKETEEASIPSYESLNAYKLETENFVENANDTISIDELTNESENTLVETEKNTVKNAVNNITNNNKNKKDYIKSSTSGTPYYIKVNYGAQVVTIYTQDDSGNYTVPAKAMVCSTGVATPKSGVYTIPRRWEWLGLQGNVYGHYATQITGNILFHSVPYLRKYDSASLEYWEYDKLGTYASAGCVRLTVADAKWIFDNCTKGTKVEFYSSSNPGHLGKPTAQKISSNVECRNWDPTDSNPNNPWKNQSPKKEKAENNNDSNKTEETQNKSEKTNKTKNNEHSNESENTPKSTKNNGNSNKTENTTNLSENNNNITRNSSNTSKTENSANQSNTNKIENSANQSNTNKIENSANQSNTNKTENSAKQSNTK